MSNSIPHQTSASSINEDAINAAEKHLRDVLSIAIEHTAAHAALVVADARCDLAIALTEAYRRCLPHATFIDFDAVAPEAVLAAFAELGANDLVIPVSYTHLTLPTSDLV